MKKQENKNVNFLGTYNNPDVALVSDYLGKWHTEGGARYVVGQLEKGAEGTLHIQYFLNFEKPGKRITQLKSHCSKSHFEVVKFNNGADAYCMKEDTRVEGPWEYGLKPARKNVKGETKERNAKILELGVEKCVEEGLIHIKEYLKVK